MPYPQENPPPSTKEHRELVSEVTKKVQEALRVQVKNPTTKKNKE